MVEERILSLLEMAVFSSVRWNCSRHCPPQFGSCPPTDPVLGQCVCKPNRIGIDCSTHLLTDHLFLPPYRHPQDTSAWDHQELEGALREVAASQGSGSCAAPAALVTGYHPGGLTASLSLIASMLSLSFALNKKTLLWRKAEVEESDNTRSVQPFAWVPPKYQTKELAQELDIDGLMKRLGLLDGPFFGVHVRLGDSCVKWKELFNGDCLSPYELISHTKSASLLFLTRLSHSPQVDGESAEERRASSQPAASLYLDRLDPALRRFLSQEARLPRSTFNYGSDSD
ncbi:hypothetical protein GUITHDRAFT_141050 [Guillardia theta CCMP2712]|uniref:EGF-like domain-containing protein n=1 Tax=Guillardia theta (strain CCMP2712) TaxID=905079 RepID=L1J281_GUITC|nr:hypothetical protein GUITHDRAFT_141050 [Guillardia theta CCMP2712]EKX42631.1 hypothetical protein GUITHDRAFT_141050 [Guillardia theta CCMP2712]|eukprot:XP_005829611.1 hypothetical protein GUITHDRAFT_141050 [Guillardia theta CCMP2712]